MSSLKKIRKSDFISISPLVFLTGLFLILSIANKDFYKVPLTVIFIATSVYALAIMKGVSMEKRISIFCRGAGNKDIMLMTLIFIFAGAFAASAKSMGAIESIVNLTLFMLPTNLLLAGIFVAGCFISLSIGTSVGTIVALIPVASELAERSGISIEIMTAAVIGGAFFGDNLSFISDTTVASTRTQHCHMKDKFKANIRIVMPAAIVSFMIYVVIGMESCVEAQNVQDIYIIKTIPYIAVFVIAILGLNVLFVLLLGNLLSGVVGIFFTDNYSVSTWIASMGEGVNSMGELIIISMLAGGLLEVIKSNGGIDYIIEKLTKCIKGKKGAEICIASLVSIANLCTANNTVAILTVGNISNDIAEKYGVDKRKSASLLDTFSCFVQGLIPYGAQILIASGLASISPVKIMPYLFYTFIVGTFATLSIFLRYPKAYS